MATTRAYGDPKRRAADACLAAYTLAQLCYYAQLQSAQVALARVRRLCSHSSAGRAAAMRGEEWSRLSSCPFGIAKLELDVRFSARHLLKLLP